jgi:pectinesterase
MQPGPRMLRSSRLAATAMAALLAALLTTLLASGSALAQRPQLSTEQAAHYARGPVLAAAGPLQALQRDGWDPLADTLITGAATPPLHYRVDPAAAAATPGSRTVFATVQQALEQLRADLAVGMPRPPRVVIGIAAGDHEGLVHVPPLPVAVTLWGLGERPEDTRLHAYTYSRMPGAEFARRYRLPPDSPYVECAQRPAIGTDCTPVMWVRNDGFQLRGLTVDNRYDEVAEGNLQQAVALSTEADRVHLEQVRLLGNQDTLFLRTPGPDRVARVFVHRSHVEGDVDFIFGAATAFFLRSRIHWVGGTRGAASGFITAASTNLHAPYGFVFEDCDFTHDGLGLAAAGKVRLGRQWFAGARCSPYGDLAQRCMLDASPIDTTLVRLERRVLEAVGKVVILGSRLGSHIDGAAPWAPWNLNRAGPAYRLAQFSSDDFWQQLAGAGHDPAAMGYRRPSPPAVFLAEHCNQGPGAASGPTGPNCSR